MENQVLTACFRIAFMFDNEVKDLFADFYAFTAPFEEALINVAPRAVSLLDDAFSMFGKEDFYAGAAEFFPTAMEFCRSNEPAVILRAR